MKIPFKLLLTRLNSTLDLMVGDDPLTIRFRVEPAKDIPLQNQVTGDFSYEHDSIRTTKKNDHHRR